MEGRESVPKFELGRLVATTGAIKALASAEIIAALSRHVLGDWGNLCKEDWELNEKALVDGSRLFSVYYSEKQVKFYVITEWNRSCTTVLLPSEY